MNKEILDVNSEIFDDFRRQLSAVLNSTVTEMNHKNVEEADLSVKIKIRLFAVAQSIGNGDFENFTEPVITHKIESRMQVKDSLSGLITGAEGRRRKLGYDNRLGKYVLMSIDNQTSMFDENEEG